MPALNTNKHRNTALVTLKSAAETYRLKLQWGCKRRSLGGFRYKSVPTLSPRHDDLGNATETRVLIASNKLRVAGPRRASGTFS